MFDATGSQHCDTAYFPGTAFAPVEALEPARSVTVWAAVRQMAASAPSSSGGARIEVAFSRYPAGRGERPRR